MPRRFRALSALTLLFTLNTAHAGWIEPFVSEIHYDNAGVDVDEFVGVSGPGGWDLTGWRLALYNGTNGRLYGLLDLTGVIGGPAGGLGEIAVPVAGLQNGPDAIALLSSTDRVVDFVAYEGVVEAVDGVARGLSARVLPVSEGPGTATGFSLQRTGSADAWSWELSPSSPGIVNAGLREQNSATIPEPTTVGVLWLAGLAGWAGVARHRRNGILGRQTRLPRLAALR